jgi:hypothetical protein
MSHGGSSRISPTTLRTPKRSETRSSTRAQQAARGRFLAELAKKGAVPSEHEVQAILRKLEGA